nr:MAG TPA: hypothetical protein [Caudoviricetes sp.]
MCGCSFYMYYILVTILRTTPKNANGLFVTLTNTN